MLSLGIKPKVNNSSYAAAATIFRAVQLRKTCEANVTMLESYFNKHRAEFWFKHLSCGRSHKHIVRNFCNNTKIQMKKNAINKHKMCDCKCKHVCNK